MGYSPWGRKELDMTELLTQTAHTEGAITFVWIFQTPMGHAQVLAHRRLYAVCPQALTSVWRRRPFKERPQISSLDRKNNNQERILKHKEGRTNSGENRNMDKYNRLNFSSVY